MGDDDIICLSSDDEFTAEQSPTKKKPTSNNQVPLRAKIEPQNEQNCAAFSSKRKSQGDQESDSVPVKKSKLTSNKVIEEIIIDSPQKDTVEEPEHRIKIPVSLENRDAISVTRKTPLKTLDIHPKSGSSSSIVLNPRNIVNRLSISKQSNNKSMTLESDDWKLTTEELSKKSSQVNTHGSTPSVAEVVHNFFSGANTDSEIAADRENISSEKILSTPKSDRPKISARGNADETATGKHSRRIETPKMSRIESQSNSSAASKICGKSNDEAYSRASSSRLPEIEIARSVKTRKNSSSSSDDHHEKLDPQNVRGIETLKPGGPKIAAESSKFTSERPIRESSASSEVVIVDDTNTSKTPVADDVRQNSALSATVGDSKSRPMPRSIKIVNSPNAVTSKKPAVSEASPECSEDSSDLPEMTNCDISNKETKKTSSLFNGIVNKPKMCLSRKSSANKDNPLDKSSSKLVCHEMPSSPKISEVAVVVKRLTPHTLESAIVPNHSKLNNSDPAADDCRNEKFSKSENGDSSSGDFKELDAKIANGLTEKKSETPKVAKVINGNSSKSKDSVSVAGCSRSSDGKRKISPKADKESARVFEPKPGCSKTPDDIDNQERPQLIVKAKMPAYTCNQDTFPMFISLCLQTDRDDAMKKIVAKLKRYYDDMDPAYARSREFEELLNAKRDKISEKGKKRVYLYTSHVMDEMKRRKRRKTKENEETDKTDGSETIPNALEDLAANETNDTVGEEEQEDDEEARRRRRTMKKIEYAMKVCAKKIQKLEEAEVGSDDDINSSYIKLDRYQVKMIELWNKMCEYTNEHADAGRAYLRPKHVRVTQIPSVDQAINSFINSRLGVNRKKSKKVTSFIDGIIFPDYVDILECIAKVNDEQKLRLDKRSQEKIAQKAFTQLGEHLQTSRRNDYWDTFSLHLENNEDPAAKDAELAEKLLQNEEINRARTAEIFEEFVRKQEEARSGNRDENSSDNEDDDEEEDEDEEEADRKSNCDVISDLELMEEEDDDDDNKNNDNQIPSPQESIDEEKKEENMEVEESAIPEEDTSADQNNDTDEIIVSAPESPKNSTVQEANENEVHTVEAECEDINKPEGEKRSLLRIRSFAKPPESWQASQEETPEECGSKPEASKSKDIETIDVTEDDKIPAVSKNPEKNEQLKTLTIAGKTVVVKRFEKNANGGVFKTDNLPKLVMISSPVTNSTKNRSPVVVQSSNKLPTNQSSRHENLNNNTANFGQTSKYLMIQPQSQPRQSSVPQQVKIPQLTGLNLNGVQQIRIRNPTIPASGQVPRMQIRPTQQHGKFSMIQHMQIPRSQLTQLRNGQYIPNTTAVPRNPELSQLPRVSLPSGNGPLVRQSIPGGSRIVQVGQVPLRGTSNLHIMRLANGHLITRPVRPQQPVQISQTGTQRDGKVTNSSEVTIVDPATNASGLSTLPVLRLRMNDNISTASTTTSATTQQQRPQQRVGRPGDQNWTPQSREAPLKK